MRASARRSSPVALNAGNLGTNARGSRAVAKRVDVTLPPMADPADRMNAYERQVWDTLKIYWDRRENKRGLPNWANTALERSKTSVKRAGARVVQAVPDAVSEPARKAADTVAAAAVRPTIAGLLKLLDLVNDWAVELNDPRFVEKLARQRGVEIDSFLDLRDQELKACDRLLSRSTLTWRTAGALEGGAMGALALVPVAGIPVAIAADVLVVQVMSVSIASRIAYSYGFDAKDPAEQEFIHGLVRRSFMAQAAKAEPLRETARAARAIKDRVRWSDKLRQDHRLVAALEKLLQHLGPAGARIPVQQVAKVVPFVGIVVGAGTNAVVLGNVAADAQRFCQTRFLCEKYDLPFPAALATADAESPE